MKIGVIVALDNEYNELRKTLGGSDEGRFGGNEVVLRKSGIGKVNAAVGAWELIRERRPDCVINSGVAGGISPALRSLDLVAASQVVYHDVWCGEGNSWGQVQGLPERFDCHPLLYGKALELSLSGSTKVHGGLVCSGDIFVSTQAETDAILGHFPEGIAVDMESGAIAQVCCMTGTPFQCLRIISDVAGDSHWENYDNFWKTLSDNSFHIIKDYLSSLPTSL